MSQSPHYPNKQTVPPAYERRVWPPEDVSENMLSRMIHTPYRTGKSKMTKKARLRLREYHHVLARRLPSGRVEVVLADCLQGFRRNNVLPRSFRKARSGWVNRATHFVNEQYQNATYERRLAPRSPNEDRDPEEVLPGDASNTIDCVVVGGPDSHEASTMVRDFMERQEVSRG